jgi:hypothetical protein
MSLCHTAQNGPFPLPKLIQRVNPLLHVITSPKNASLSPYAKHDETVRKLSTGEFFPLKLPEILDYHF